MKVIKTKDEVEIILYSSASELPIKRYTEFQKYLLLEASVEGFSFILEKVKAYIQSCEYELACNEIGKAIFSLNNVMSGISSTTYAFACLVAKIGEKHVSDVTIDGLGFVVAELFKYDISFDEIKDYIGDFKKKVDDELSKLFPDYFSQLSSDTSYYCKMQSFIIALGNCDFEDTFDLKRINDIQNEFILLNNEQSNTNELDKRLLLLCALMEENGSTYPQQYTVVEFYAKLDYINKREDARRKRDTIPS